MHKPVKHLVVAAASIVVAVGSPAAQTIDMVVDSAIYTIELNASAAFAYYVPWGNLCLFRIGGNAPSRDLVELGGVDETALQAVIQSGGREVELRAR